MRLASLCLLFVVPPVLAQVPPKPEPPGIQDNSFLIEEAYNQEQGVVQHISSFARNWHGGSWAYTFTQEWPVGGPRHQLSGTLTFVDAGEGGERGLGDAAVNYRFQWIGSGEARLACAPRLSLILPTGDYRKELGAGGLGVQLSLPLSLALSRRVVVHGNVGLTLVPSARNAAGARAGTTGFNLGASLVWLAHPRLNFMLETIWARNQAVTGPGATESSESAFVSPGLRWAYNFASGLQIVPGIAFPIGLGASRDDSALLLYLSFEHPFRHR